MKKQFGYPSPFLVSEGVYREIWSALRLLKIRSKINLFFYIVSFSTLLKIERIRKYYFLHSRHKKEKLKPMTSAKKNYFLSKKKKKEKEIFSCVDFFVLAFLCQYNFICECWDF